MPSMSSTWQHCLWGPCTHGSPKIEHMPGLHCRLYSVKNQTATALVPAGWLLGLVVSAQFTLSKQAAGRKVSLLGGRVKIEGTLFYFYYFY